MNKEKLIDTRKELGLTQKEMAKLVGLSFGGYKKLEYGEREAAISTYRRISQITGKSILELI